MSYWILITHIASMFPIGVYLWSWKKRKDTSSIYMIFHTIFVVIFSILYHTDDVTDSNAIHMNNDIWTLLDHSQSTVLIITTIFYVLRIREPQFYIVSYICNTLTLILYLFEYYQMTVYLMIITTSCTGIIKWRTIWRYIKFFYYNSVLTILCGICSIISFIIAKEHNNNIYIIYHSLWHFFIFTTAGLGSLLRYKLDKKLYPITRNRDPLFSNEMIVINNNENEN